MGSYLRSLCNCEVSEREPPEERNTDRRNARDERHKWEPQRRGTQERRETQEETDKHTQRRQPHTEETSGEETYSAQNNTKVTEAGF